MSNNVFQNIQLQRIADAMQGGGSSVTVNIDVTGAGDMQPATATAAGAHGLVPAPQAGDENKVLSGAGVWVEAGGGGSGTTYTVLSDTTHTTNAWVNPITVSCNPLDYDIIIFDISNSDGGNYYCITFPHTFPLDSGNGTNCRYYALEGNFIAYPARFSDGMGMFTSTNTTLNVNKVTGIKFGGIL